MTSIKLAFLFFVFSNFRVFMIGFPLVSPGFGFGNPGEPKTVEWALARSRQKRVQAAPQEQNCQHQSYHGDFGFVRVLADFFAPENITT